MTGPGRRNPEDELRVGNRLRGGQLSAGLDGTMAWVNCSLLGTGVTVHLTAREIRLAADFLAQLAAKAATSG